MIGFTVHTPPKRTEGDWQTPETILRAVPEGTPVRDDVQWHDRHWERKAPKGPESYRRKLEVLSLAGGPVILAITPQPWQGAGWWLSGLGNKGYIDPREEAEIAQKFAQDVTDLRAIWKELGRKESDLFFQIGNEAGSGHAGGFWGLPRGEWWERHARLYLACLKAARFGRAKVIGPALSFQDEAEQIAAREWESARAFYRIIARELDFSAGHFRLHAPRLEFAEYSEDWIAGVEALRSRVADMTGLPCAITESYVAEMDCSDRSKALPLIARHEYDGMTLLYRLGGGPDADLFELPVAALTSANPTTSD